MREYERHLKEYPVTGFWIFSRNLTEEEWGNIEVAEDYLKKYWLPTSEYERMWKPIQDKIFVNYDRGLANYIIADGYEFLALNGGILFTKENFTQLQECMRGIGDQYFVVIENTYGGLLDEPPFQMKYPANISWDELMSGGFISSIMFEAPHNEYFIFGESGVWGKYAANDYENPLDIVVFKPEHAELFHEKMSIIEDQPEKVYGEWLPPVYKERLRLNEGT